MFYVCVNGQKVQQRCGPGLHWNVEKGELLYLRIVKLNRYRAAMFNILYSTFTIYLATDKLKIEIKKLYCNVYLGLKNKATVY